MTNDELNGLGYTLTVDDLLDMAMEMMGEDQKSRRGYAPYAAGITNFLLADCFHANNAVRTQAQKQALTELPSVSVGTDVLPYEYETVINLLMPGMAFYLLVQDDENDKANIFNAVYEANKAKYPKTLPAEYEKTENNYRW